MNLRTRSFIHIVKPKSAGFTLLEILIALFIFTILSMILMTSLQSVIKALSGTEANADRLRKLQITFLIMSRDVEQILNRPILDASGNEEIAFIGTPRAFTFTHLGYASLTGTIASSGMQRTRYFLSQNALWRMTWAALDQSPTSRPHSRALLENVSDLRFQYLDNEGRFQDNWPVEGEANQPLPRAVRIILTFSNWGKISQLYVISAQSSKNSQQPPPNNPASQSDSES